MMDEQLEYAISQKIDGHLPLLERDALQKQLDADPSAYETEREYLQLDRLLRESMPYVPAIDYDLLSAHLSSVIRAEEAPLRSNYRIGWFRNVASIALAACVLVGIGLWGMQRSKTQTQQPVQYVRVTGPSIEAATGTPILRVGIGPAPVDVAEYVPSAASDALTSRATQILIASSGVPEPDQLSLLY